MDAMYIALLATKQVTCEEDCGTLDCSGSTTYSGYCFQCYLDLCDGA
jgi:hypothetical protein